MSFSQPAERTGFLGFLERSLAAIRAEQPLPYRSLCDAIGTRSLALEVDGEAIRLAVHDGEVELGTGPAAAAVHVVAGHEVISALIDAELDLVQAVLGGHLHLRGMPDDLVTFDDALRAYLHGAVRSPSCPALLREYRTGVTRGDHARREST